MPERRGSRSKRAPLGRSRRAELGVIDFTL
jgi:hypothetical protein